jgi:hypothetical protein
VTGEPPPRRRLSVGAELTSSGVHFRVWAPACRHVEAVIEGRDPIPLRPEPGPRYGGRGSPPPFHDGGARITGHAAMVLVPEEAERG